jgi:nitroimidazol reductase NimA-like FMN-containing flavoprotein (pyridoxamine 5'-phosphate oxidase superfamily)
MGGIYTDYRISSNFIALKKSYRYDEDGFEICPPTIQMERGLKGTRKMLEKMKDLVRSQNVCVLATVSGDQPHCSLMSYAADADCREMYMVTFRKTKKYRNLKDNPAVSLLIDTRKEDLGEKRHEVRALTVNGLFEDVKDQKKRDMIRALLLERHPHLNVLAEDPDAEFFTVRIKEASFATVE